MVGPGIQLDTSRDVHGPLLASYVTSEHYEAIDYKRYRELLGERVSTPFHERQEANPSMPENERDKFGGGPHQDPRRSNLSIDARPYG